MLLHRLSLNLRCREVRRDLASPYELHSTLCRAFSSSQEKCPASAFLWRLESIPDNFGNPQVLIQSSINPDWSRIRVDGWFANPPAAPLNLTTQLDLKNLCVGQRFRFRLRANPCVCQEGKRQGLLLIEDQERWIDRKGLSHGFQLPKLSSFAVNEPERIDVMISQDQMLKSRQRTGNEIRVFSVQFDGLLTVTEVEKFCSTLKSGIGHGKTMGLGLLSVVPVS
jgi:CRISPR system Cascade subunit CasE